MLLFIRPETRTKESNEYASIGKKRHMRNEPLAKRTLLL